MAPTSESEVLKQVLVSVVVCLVVVALYIAWAPHASRRRTDIPGFEDLVPCAFLTSIDSRRSLYLSGHHDARTSETTGNGTTWSSGTWTLVDDDRHVYRVDIDGVSTTYTLVSAPEGEGCMLVAGSLDAADLHRSWFSALTDPK